MTHPCLRLPCSDHHPESSNSSSNKGGQGHDKDDPSSSDSSLDSSHRDIRLLQSVAVPSTDLSTNQNTNKMVAPTPVRDITINTVTHHSRPRTSSSGYKSPARMRQRATTEARDSGRYPTPNSRHSAATNSRSKLKYPSRHSYRASPLKSRTTSAGRPQQPSTPKQQTTATRGGYDSRRDPPPVSSSAVPANEPVCDYDTSATVLYELLESSQWDQARMRCKSHPDECRTWIVRRDSHGHRTMRWKLLPLHAAIIFQAPTPVIQSLLDKYPMAAARVDDQGMLPLHLAFRHFAGGDEDVLEVLLVQYPKAVLLRDRRDRVPLEHGREGHFSAKLMRLYADATVAGTRLAHHKHDCNATAPTLPTALTSSERTRLENEYTQRVEFERQQFEAEIARLKASYEHRLVEVQEAQVQLDQDWQQRAQVDRQTLIQQHQDQMDDLRHLLGDQLNKDKSMVEALQHELGHLKAQVQDYQDRQQQLQADQEVWTTQRTQLEEELRRAGQDYQRIRQVALTQQQDLSQARTLRRQLVESLWQHEEDHAEDTATTAIVQAAETNTRRIRQVLEVSSSPPRSKSRSSQRQRAEPKEEKLNRLERDRILSPSSEQQQPQSRPQTPYQEAEEMVEAAVETSIPVVRPVDDYSAAPRPRTSVLADDISGITELSRY